MTTTMSPTKQDPGRGGPRRKSPALLGVLVLFIATACVAVFVAMFVLGKPRTPQAGSPAATLVRPGSVVDDEITTIPQVRMPQPEWSSLVVELTALDHELRVHPDPGRLTELMTLDNPGLQEAQAAMEQLAGGTWRYDPVPSSAVVQRAELLTSSANDAEVAVTLTTPQYRVVGGDSVIVDLPARTFGAVWSLHFDGRWRMAGVEG